MSFRTAYAQYEGDGSVAGVEKAVASLKNQFSGFKVGRIIYFASIRFDPDALAKAMQAAFPDIITVGSTSYGGEVDTHIFKDALVAMGFSDEVFDELYSGLLLGDGRQPAGRGQYASFDALLQSFEKQIGRKVEDLDYHEYVGVVIASRMSPFTASVLERLGDVSDVLFTGGCAGDDLSFNKSLVFFDGLSLSNAILVIIARPSKGFSLLKTQAFSLTDKVFAITRLDRDKDVIWEFDGRPAAEVLAEAIGIATDDLAGNIFGEYQLTIPVHNQILPQTILDVVDNRGLRMFSPLFEGMRMTLAKATDIVESTAASLVEKKEEMGSVSAILHFNCVLRHDTIVKKQLERQYGDLFKGIPTIACSSNGEMNIGVVSQTSCMLLFK